MQAAAGIPAINPASLSPRAASYFQNVFQARFAALQQQIPQTPFSVLLWGPGPGSLALYNKRVQIRDELRARGQAAFLSEEVAPASNDAILPRVQNLLQATAADLVVVMVATMADVGNASEFSADKVVQNKLLVFAPAAALVMPAYRDALAQLEQQYDNVKSFLLPQDLESCHLKTMVMDKLAELQLVKWRATQNPVG